MTQSLSVSLVLLALTFLGDTWRVTAKPIQQEQESVKALTNQDVVTASVESLTVIIPRGTLVEIETAYRISSQEVKPGEAISFKVVNPVRVGEKTVIAAGSIATGRIVKATRGGHFGRAGRLAWTMETVNAIDDSRVPIQATGRVVGDSKGAKVATRAVITGALLWPIAPVALLHGFKRGENAYVAQGRRLEVTVSADTKVVLSSIR
jgi:hypothetical protein